MATRIWFHLESTDDRRMVWWAETPDIPGVYASGDSLNETRLVVEQIIRTALAEQGKPAPDFEYAIMEDPPAESDLSEDDSRQLTAIAS